MQTLLDDAKKELAEGEEILWHGQGTSRFLLSGNEWLCLGVVLYQVWSFFFLTGNVEYADLKEMPDKVFYLLNWLAYALVPILLFFGLGVPRIRMNWRKNSLYVLTNERVLLLHGKGTETVSYKGLKAVHLVRHWGGRESIIFEPLQSNIPVSYGMLLTTYRYMGGSGQIVHFPMLEDAAEAKAVLSQIAPGKLDNELVGEAA
ncbi:hypothetical protein [Kordiimonas laminariae]|uniref:hypothetical protein n=1 Tax=Kordiimonas laminariae TaxID=2917717 RepID=UPI001FF6D9BA|nr:hypothetical protein [Kordiimonas laminariae]MCK0068005.1 hypothetical protein [Kordiimonas laminariae]